MKQTMKERTVDPERAIIAHDQAPVIVQPADRSFDNPAPLVAPQCVTTLRGRPDAIPLVRKTYYQCSSTYLWLHYK